LWEKSKLDADADEVETCTIITTTPNEVLKPIHNRMPAIVRPTDYQKWLNPKLSGTSVRDLLKLIAADEIEAYPVDRHVHSTTNNGSDLIQLAHEREDSK
jgi:putative SOS response-associated peptidase YedK